VTFEAATRVRATIPSLKLRQNVEWIECETIRQALEVSAIKGQAARLMGISPRALSHYLAKYPSIDRNRNYGIDAPSIRGKMHARCNERAPSLTIPERLAVHDGDAWRPLSDRGQG
jgi:hypothetical protein